MTNKRKSRAPRTKEMLLPLPAAIMRSISLENHLSLATMRSGHGTPDTMVALLLVLYMTFYLLDRNPPAADLALFLEAEAALDESIRAANRGRDWQLAAEQLPVIEQVLRRCDELMGCVPRYCYVQAWERLHRSGAWAVAKNARQRVACAAAVDRQA